MIVYMHRLLYDELTTFILATVIAALSLVTICFNISQNSILVYEYYTYEV